MAEGGREASGEIRQMKDRGMGNTVEVSGFSTNTSQELLENYFENSRRSGGGDMEEIHIRDGVAYITFKNAEVAQRVVSRNNHQVDGRTLTVTLLHTSPLRSYYTNRVLIQGLNSAVTEDLLRNFLEAVTESEVREFLYGEEEGNVVVTLSDNIDIGQLRKTFQERRIEGAVLKVERVAISRCILVQNIQTSMSHDVVLFYFDNKRKSFGGNVERVEMKADEGYCLVYFEDHSVMDRVLSQSHKVDGADLEVHLHYECLGQRSSRNKSDPYLRISNPVNKDGGIDEVEKTDNQSNDEDSSSVSSNPDKESDFVEVQEWQENDDEESSSVSSNPDKESDFLEVQKMQESEVFPYQWEKFQVRFETDNAKYHLSSMDYAIKEVSPIQMQYIADNGDERDSLLERLKSKNLKGMLESGLLRIYLQEERDIRKMKEDQDYVSEMKNKVITTLRSHIETHPAIQTEQLSQVVLENVQQAQELEHLECLRSNRVKIYICKFGKGVSIVGREVGKYIESICRAYGETSKNDAVCSISESVGIKTENAAESLKQFEKASIEITESETRVTLDRSTIQLLTDSDFARELCKEISKVSVILLSSEVIFKGPHQALNIAKSYIQRHLKSKGYWHEVEQAASLIETSKRLNFEAYLKGNFPDVRVLFTDGKVVFIGKENTVKACEGELAKFHSAIKRDCIELKSFFLSYLKFQDVQNYIWEMFESRHIECYWHVIENGIAFYFRNVEHFSAAKSVLKECAASRKFSFESVSDLQEFENIQDVKNLIHENKGRLHKEVLQAHRVIYVGMPKVIAQIKELRGRHKADLKNQSQGHSSEVLLSNILLAYVRKYLMENIRKKFDVNLLELGDLSGIKITGAEDHVKNAVSEVKQILDQKQVFIDSLEISKVTNTITRQLKENVATVEEESMTCVEVVSIPIKGKETLTVSVGKALDVCLVYGSTPEREGVMQMIPVNDSLFPVCLAATDIMIKGVDLQEKAARALRKYANQNGEKPKAFKFIPDDGGGSGQHIVFFVMPDFSFSMVDFQKQLQAGLVAVLDYAYITNVTSLSLPIEMNEKLSVRQIYTVIMEALNIFLGIVEHKKKKNMKEIFLCSAEKGNQSILKQLLKSTMPGEASSGEIIIWDYFVYDEEEDSQVNIVLVTGSLLDQKVDIIVSFTTAKLDLQTGSLSKGILDVAGNSIQDECIQKYPNGIKFGEVAVTSAGRLKYKRIFHGALRKVDEKNLHLQSLRSLMKNCLQKVKEEKCHSIAFPALGIGQLKYPVEAVAKEMFRAVINHADKYGVKLIKFVLPEGDTNVYNAFKEMENTKNSLIQSSTDCKTEYEVSLEGYGVKIAIVAAKKYTMPCDVDIVWGSPALDALTEKHIVKYGGSSEKIITVKRDTKNWSETLYLCLRNVSSFKKDLTHAVYYVSHMKFTSLSVHISHITESDMARSAIEDVIVALDTCKSDAGDLESVMIVISDVMLQSLTPWFDENVKASQGSKTIMSKLSTYFGFKVPTIWKFFKKTSRTYLRIAVDASLTYSKIHDTIQKRLKEFETNGEQVKTRSSESSNTSTGSFDIVKVPNQETESTIRQKYQDESPNAWRNKVEGTSALTPEKTDGTGSCPSKTDLSEVDQEDIMAFMECKMEVGEDVLNSIKITHGQQGIDSLISDLDQYAKVDMYEGRVLVLCDYKHAENVQRCVKSHYDKVKKERKTADQNKHLINGGNDNLKEWLRFAYAHTSWIKNLQLEGGKLYLTGTLQMKKEVEKAVHSMNYWYREEFVFTSEEQQKAVEVSALVKNELPAVFIKQTKETMIVLSDNRDNFERANYKVKVALGRIKITARGRGSRDPQLYSGMSKEDKMDANPKRPSSGFQSNQPTADLALKSYCTKEGLMAKVYLGNITSLPVDCIVNAANGFLSHGGGVALAISKAAGEDFDQEGEEYVRKNGPVQVTQCCVTSAGRLPYKFVIHAVGPQWSDYKDNEKDRCIDDLKKTIVSCMIKANKFKMASIAIPPLSSGIFGVPKDLCAQMYAKGVVEYSKNYGLQFVKEIHFVDTVSEMCQLTQSAFDKELM